MSADVAVWVALPCGYDEYGIEGVFSSLEKAVTAHRCDAAVTSFAGEQIDCGCGNNCSDPWGVEQHTIDRPSSP